MKLTRAQALCLLPALCSAVAPSPPAPAPTSEAFLARALRRLTSFDEAKISRIVGDTALLPPHPFVQTLDDSNVEETLLASDDDTVWAILVSANDQPSVLFDDTWNQVASNSTLALDPPREPSREDELPVRPLSPNDPGLMPSNLRFGRIDYLRGSDFVLSKWLVFKCPMIVFATERGTELRFFPSGTVPSNPDRLGAILRAETWRRHQPWTGTFSPTGSGAWLPLALGRASVGFHRATDTIPSWLLMTVCTGLSTLILQWLHLGSAKNKRPKPAEANATHPAAASSATGRAQASAARRRKRQ